MTKPRIEVMVWLPHGGAFIAKLPVPVIDPSGHDDASLRHAIREAIRRDVMSRIRVVIGANEVNQVAKVMRAGTKPRRTR